MRSPESRLARRHELRKHCFKHAGFAVELIAPRSPDDLIDVSEFNVDERLPYWAELWPSARALATELLERADLPPRILELGCGLALPSLALRWRNAEVVASDYYSEALEFTVANALRNGIPAPATLSLDWRSPPDDLAPFDLVIAADVLYERRNAEILADLLPQVTRPGGSVLFADPGRAYTPLFCRLMERQEWSVEQTGRRMVPGAAPGREVLINILTLMPVDGRGSHGRTVPGQARLE